MRHVFNVLSLLISPILGQSFRYLCSNSLCRELVETFKIIDQTKIRPCNSVFCEKDVQIKVFITLVFETYERYINNVRM